MAEKEKGKITIEPHNYADAVHQQALRREEIKSRERDEKTKYGN